MSPCRTLTVVSKLVRSKLNKDKETRVSSHPRSNRQGSRLSSNGSIRIRKSTNEHKVYLCNNRLREMRFASFKSLEKTKIGLFVTKARNKLRTTTKSTKKPRILPENSKQCILKRFELVKKSENE